MANNYTVDLGKSRALILALASMPLAPARDVSLEWDPNPPGEGVTIYRAEIRTESGEWVALKNDIPHEVVPSVVITGADGQPADAIAARFQGFPDRPAEVRLFASDGKTESFPSEVFLVELEPSSPAGIRLVQRHLSPM